MMGYQEGKMGTLKARGGLNLNDEIVPGWGTSFAASRTKKKGGGDRLEIRLWEKRMGGGNFIH